LLIIQSNYYYYAGTNKTDVNLIDQKLKLKKKKKKKKKTTPYFLSIFWAKQVERLQAHPLNLVLSTAIQKQAPT
jgi:hypothetical protein